MSDVVPVSKNFLSASWTHPSVFTSSYEGEAFCFSGLKALPDMRPFNHWPLFLRVFPENRKTTGAACS
jgi:hypothetical protein